MIKRFIRSTICLLTMTASPAFAEFLDKEITQELFLLSCHFTQECIDNDCNETDYEMSARYGLTGISEDIVLETTDTVETLVMTANMIDLNNMLIVAQGADESRAVSMVMTVKDKDGFHALLTQTLIQSSEQSPMLVSYQGSCSVAAPKGNE